MEFEILQGHKIPVVRCKEKDGQWYFFCEFCKRNHYHGPLPGHRNAHCHSELSPFGRTGYILRLEGDKS